MDESWTINGEPRAVDGGRGFEWWRQAWALFARSAGMWIVLGLILLVILAVLALVPIVGSLATCLLTPVFVASWMQAARKVDAGGTLEVGDLFTAFKGDRLMPLVAVGALLLAMIAIIFAVMMVFGLGGTIGLLGSTRRGAGGVWAGFGLGLVTGLIGLVLLALASMAVWFAPALVALRGTAPVAALKASVAGNLKNIVPMLLWLVIYLVAGIVASIPFGLGWIVLGPVLLLTLYTSYKDIYGG